MSFTKERFLLGAGRRAPLASLLLLGVSATSFVVPGAGGLLEWHRERLAAGEWWRIVSGHWTHFSLDHLLWDGLAFAFLAPACERRGRVRFLLALLASSFAISLGAGALAPAIAVYRGLSGLDSALMALLVLDLFREARRGGERAQAAAALAISALFLAKIAYEAAGGRSLFVEHAAAGFTPVPLAHILGALAGAAASLLPQAWTSRQEPWQRVPQGRTGHGRGAAEIWSSGYIR